MVSSAFTSGGAGKLCLVGGVTELAAVDEEVLVVLVSLGNLRLAWDGMWEVVLGASDVGTAGVRASLSPLMSVFSPPSSQGWGLWGSLPPGCCACRLTVGALGGPPETV